MHCYSSGGLRVGVCCINDMKGIFELNTASDLLEKLERDYEKLCNEPLDSDAAFNFFVTANCMLDWVYPDHKAYDKDQNEKRAYLKKGNSILEICDHIASGAKHFTVHATHHKSVSDTHRCGSWGTPFSDPKWFNADWGFQGRLDIMLNSDAQIEFGESISSQELAKKVIDYWKNYLSEDKGAK